MIVDGKKWFAVWSGNQYNDMAFNDLPYQPNAIGISSTLPSSKQDALSLSKSFGDSNYLLIETANMNWQQAQQFCESYGGHLATVTTASENAFIFDLMNNGTKTWYWIGGVWDANQSPKWITGEKFNNSIVVLNDSWGNSLSGHLGGYRNINGYSSGIWYKGRTVDSPIENYVPLSFVCEWDKKIILLDSDEDDLPDIYETRGMPLANGTIIYTNPNNSDTDGDTLIDGIELNPTIRSCTVLTTNLQNGNWTNIPKTKYFFEMESNPTKKDSDGDGISDNRDPQKLNVFDERFMIVDNNETLPNIDFVDRHLARGQNCYNSRIEEWNQNLLYIKYCLYAAGGYITPVQSWLNKDLIKDYEWAISPKYAYFLDYYLANIGGTMFLSNEDMYSIVYGQQSNKEHYSYNINQLKKAAEEMIILNGSPNDKIYISTTSGNNFKCACYKGHNCEAHGYQYDDAIAAGWGYATGDSLCAMQAEVYTYGDTYYMKTKYYLIDTYEFPIHWSEGDAKNTLNQEAHALHEWGLAKEYKIVGILEDFVTWKQGEVLYEYDYCDIILNTSEYDSVAIS